MILSLQDTKQWYKDELKDIEFLREWRIKHMHDTNQVEWADACLRHCYKIIKSLREDLDYYEEQNTHNKTNNPSRAKSGKRIII